MIFQTEGKNQSFTQLEICFMREVFTSLYHCIKDPMSKFIIMSHFECGYSQDDVARMLGISQPTVVQRIKKLQEKLKLYRKHGYI